MVRKGSNIYESYARLHLGWTGGKLKAEDPKLYALSKAMVLGLGYGCGAVKFKELLSDVYGIETTLVKATGLVNEFRQSNPGITRLWHDYNRKLANSVKSNLLVDLPGGRQLKFLNINRDNQGDIKCQFGFGGLFKKIYGSKVCENVVQSVARDVFCDGMLRVAQAGYAILLHFHDELVVEVEDQKDLDKVAAIMKIPPVWMKDLPIDVGAELVDHYKK
jgi:DNA polymerase